MILLHVLIKFCVIEPTYNSLQTSILGRFLICLRLSISFRADHCMTIIFQKKQFALEK